MHKLLTLKEHQERVVKMSKYDSGVECPICGHELQYWNPGVLMLSSPPQAEVKCYNCNYATHIYVSKRY